MKKYLILLLFTATFMIVNAQNKFEKKPYLTQSFSGATINSVVSKTSGGNISVTAVSPSESKVEVFVTQNGNSLNSLSDDEIKTKIVEDYDLDISVNNGNLTVTAKPKHEITNWKHALRFSFKIFVDQKVSTKLETSGGNIALKGISGNQDFKTSGGNLSLEELSGTIKGKTSGGNIYVRNCKDGLDLSTSGGNILAKNAKGHIHISTSGGSIKLSNLKGNINASTNGGNIEGEVIDGELSASTSGGNVSLQKLSCNLKASTSGGNIDVSIQNPGKYVTIHNSAGKVSLTIPKNTSMDLKLNAMKISTQNLENFNGKTSKEEINGTVNGGGIPVVIDAGGGKIDVVFN
ncbi:MAG: hypothetical protein Q8891_08650 [Bacteroidota bacterium]|nr:hypothetical protein [Bacteroidota bacterium]